MVCSFTLTLLSSLRRFTRNLFLRQGSHQPTTLTPSPLARSHTISGAQPSRNQSQGQNSIQPINPLSTVSTATSNNPLSAEAGLNLTLESFEGTEDVVEVSGKEVHEDETAVAEKSDEEEVKSKDTNVAMETEIRKVPRQESVNMEIRQSPGFKFITRPDLFKFAKV